MIILKIMKYLVYKMNMNYEYSLQNQKYNHMKSYINQIINDLNNLK